MPGRNYYLLTALPALGDLGQDPPIGLGEFLDHVEPADKPRREAQAIFLADDLLQREAALAGESHEPEPTVLTAEQVRGDAPLPDPLAGEGEDEGEGDARLETDAVRAAYYRHVARLGESSDFLEQFVRFEVGLRNALAAARAKALHLDPERYLVAPELGADMDEFEGVVSEWSAAANPLAGQQVLDRARWDWLEAHDAWFSFADDELAAYAAKLLLLHRWRRIRRAEPAADPEQT